jgi:Flp pilus assembly pilin Flp
MRRRIRTQRPRGAVLVEYALLLTFFAVPVMAGITAMGVRLMNDFRTTRSVILAPFP